MRQKAISNSFKNAFTVLVIIMTITLVVMNVTTNKGVLTSLGEEEQSSKLEETDVYVPHIYHGVYNTTESVERVKPVTDRTNIKQSPYINTKLYVNTTGEVAKKIILWWNAPGWLEQWSDRVDMNQCSYSNCMVSYDRGKFHSSDAVIFSITDAKMGKPPIPQHLRNPDQAWIFFTLESPVYVQLETRRFMSQPWHNVFNWSWTYRPDADIFHPYGTVRTKENIPSRNFSNIFRNKKKMVAWAVSHCRTFSERERYVDMLKKYIPVDIYGKCGDEAPQNLEQVLQQDYMFYLGFENSMCTDYITEKFFHYYKLDMVTIVRGKTNYTKNLPEGSFIDTSRFKSIKDLAFSLKDLASDEQRYTEYLKKKDIFQVYERDYLYRNALCNICEKVNNLDKHRKSYGNIGEWLGLCYKPNDFVR